MIKENAYVFAHENIMTYQELLEKMAKFIHSWFLELVCKLLLTPWSNQTVLRIIHALENVRNYAF